jgi:hypothetical protein
MHQRVLLAPTAPVATAELADLAAMVRMVLMARMACFPVKAVVMVRPAATVVMGGLGVLAV